MVFRSIAAGLVLAFCISPPAAAQNWDSPTFFAPRSHDDVGLYLLKIEDFDDVGFAGIWRQSGNINLGLRAGRAAGDLGWLVGVELYGPLNVFGPASTVLASWMVGGGAVFDDFTLLRIPVGVSFGLDLGSGGVAITPYVHPRVAFDLFTEGEGRNEDTETEFNVDVDIGADIALGDSFVLRGGFTIGDLNNFGVGLAYRIPRRVVVR